MSFPGMLYGTEIRYTTSAVTTPWIFPDHPYIEYEPKDEWWCRKYGIGHEGKSEPCVILMNKSGYLPGARDVLLVHPSLKKAFEEQIKEWKP